MRAVDWIDRGVMSERKVHVNDLIIYPDDAPKVPEECFAFLEYIQDQTIATLGLKNIEALTKPAKSTDTGEKILEQTKRRMEMHGFRPNR